MGVKAVESQHYKNDPNGNVATVRFTPGNHQYRVTDPGFTFKGKEYSYDNEIAGGATSVTGVMDKGKGLQMWPMWEMNKFLEKYFTETSIQEMMASDLNLGDILKMGRDAHVKKSDLGKSVGTDVHDYAEKYLLALQAHQEGRAKEFVQPEVPTVEEIKDILKRRYVEVIDTLRPQTPEEFLKLPKLLTQDIQIQEAMWTESTMIIKGINAFRDWCDQHKIKVIGAEQNTYSRTAASKYLDAPKPQCGYYDATLEVTCSKQCGWCYLNRDAKAKINDDFTYTDIYIVDFKTTNTSSEFVMGIYPEYLPQCGVYDLGITEEFPELKVGGHLILNASKQDGGFAPFFSFERERNREWACHLIAVKEMRWSATNEVKKAGEAHAKFLEQETKKAGRP